MTIDLRPIHGGRILDVATGQGGFVQYLLESLAGYEEITGIDTSPGSEEAFRRNFADQPRVHFLQMDAAQMTFADNSFDTMCIANSLHHLANLPGVLAEMQRVLRPGGWMIIAEMFCDGQTDTQMTHVLLHHWWAAVDIELGITHFETFPRDKIVQLVESLHLIDIAIEDQSDIASDPKDPQVVQQLDGIIDRYIARATGLANQAELQQRGETLRSRVHETGFHGAASLLAAGRKP